MKTSLLVVVVLALLALDWAALHDIIKGNETSYWQEYAMLWFSGLVFTGMALIFFYRKLQGDRSA